VSQKVLKHESTSLRDNTSFQAKEPRSFLKLVRLVKEKSRVSLLSIVRGFLLSEVGMDKKFIKWSLTSNKIVPVWRSWLKLLHKIWSIRE
jgi:hypothetical protein